MKNTGQVPGENDETPAELPAPMWVVFILLGAILLYVGFTIGGFMAQKKVTAAQSEVRRLTGEIATLRDDSPLSVGEGDVQIQLRRSGPDDLPVHMIPLLMFRSSAPQAFACGRILKVGDKPVLVGMDLDEDRIGEVVTNPGDQAFVAAQKQ